MQTFLPYPDFAQSARCLDRQRLGKQRVECKQILISLTQGTGWKHHPATRMWTGHEIKLCEYAMRMCDEWSLRGYTDNLYDYFDEFRCDHLDLNDEPPHWLGHKHFHMSHQSQLFFKDPLWYSQFDWYIVPGMEYYWPRIDQ